RMLVEAAPDGLRIRLDVGAADLTAIPLPGSLDEWSPELVTVDGGPAGAMSRTPDGRLWLVLTQGPHQLVLEGPLARRESVRLHLPLRPKRLEARLAGWTLAGLRDDGAPEDTLQLTRERPESEDARREIEPGALPPFVTVDRSLLLGVDWRVRTVARRRTPLGTPIVLKVPLLPGEAVLTAGIDVRDGAALVNLGPRAASAGWESTLPAGPRIDLRAAESGSLGERWHLRASPIWHVEFEGILPIYREEAKSDAGLTWAPWPGESVTVSIDRPAGAEGPTLTIDRASLIVRPGLRAVDGVLEMSIRSSRGTQHPIGLPKGAILESVAIGGQAQPVEAIDGVVTVPIAPGTTALRVAWRSPGGPGRRLETPRVDLGAPAVNLDIRVESSRDRWILFAGGPRVGPAVLFWSFLVILLPLAWVLGRLPWTPLRARHWFGLGVGLTQVNIVVAAVVAGWLFALGWRRVRPGLDDRGAFNLRQIALVLWTLVALAGLVWGIEQGLLGLPEMQIAGNGSGPELLRWFVDRAPARVPVAWVLSAPLYAYRVAMLLWALWIAWALIRWLRWGWECFGTGGYWRPRAPRAEGPVRGL
ncbi:MAG: hypothetical protein KC466_11370, partial [Myxococcales bacterium]|nr:hypothetical protein [Myxococcales bacterium]